MNLVWNIHLGVKFCTEVWTLLKNGVKKYLSRNDEKSNFSSRDRSRSRHKDRHRISSKEHRRDRGHENGRSGDYN